MRHYQSKSKRLTETIRQDIAKGNFSFFPHLPSEVRLAELYGSARATIRKALSELVDDGILVRGVKQLSIAPEYRSKPVGGDHVPVARSRKIGGVFPMEDATINGLLAGITGAAERLEMDFQYFLRIPQNPESWVAELTACGFDGLLLIPLELENYRAFYRKLQEVKLPLVCLDRTFYGNEESCTCVEADNRAGTYRAVTRLIMLYRRPVHFFCYHLNDSTSATERYEGYLAAMQDAGFGRETEEASHFFDFIDLTRFPEKHILSGALRALRTLTPPVSIFTLNDYAAYAVYMACDVLNWKIGEDVKIISFDDSPLAYRLQPRLSGMRQPLEEIGATAVELLRRIIDGEVTQPMQLKVPVTLVEKESSLPGNCKITSEQSSRTLTYNGINK